MADNGVQGGARRGSGTEYHSRYREYDFQPREAPFRPKPEPIDRDAVMETATTNKQDYIEHPVRRQAAVRPQDNQLQQQGDHDFLSSYNNTFVGQTGERVKPIRQDRNARPQLDKFQGEASYKADFQEWALPSRHRREQAEWAPPNQRFEGGTTSQGAFMDHGVSRRQPVKRLDEWGGPQGPFQGSTGYKDSFKQHDVQPRLPRQRQLWTSPAVKFDAKTTNLDSFTGPYQPKRESCRPDRAALMSDTPFDSKTTNKSDFQEKPLGQRFVHGYQPYIKPEGHMDLNTTNQAQFREFPPIARVALEKPGSSNILRGQGPMATESGYNADFAEHMGSPRREMMKPRNNYEAPDAKFEGQSTSKGDFIEKKLSPRETYRPKWEPVTSNVPIETATENRSSFVEQAVQPRRRRERETFSQPSVPFQASTTALESYQGSFAPKRTPFKPENNSVSSDVKFEGRTTMMNDFQEHTVSPRHRHEQDRYVRPEGAMDLTTSNRRDFQENGPQQRSVITKPGSSHVMRGEGPFAGASSYKGDFTQPLPQVRQMVKPKNNYQPSVDRFEGTTTQRTAFQGAYQPKQGSFRPQNRPLQKLDAFEDSTGYKAEFQAWRDAAPAHPVTVQ